MSISLEDLMIKNIEYKYKWRITFTSQLIEIKTYLEEFPQNVFMK